MNSLTATFCKFVILQSLLKELRLNAIMHRFMHARIDVEKEALLFFELFVFQEKCIYFYPFSNMCTLLKVFIYPCIFCLWKYIKYFPCLANNTTFG